MPTKAELLDRIAHLEREVEWRDGEFIHMHNQLEEALSQEALWKRSSQGLFRLSDHHADNAVHYAILAQTFEALAEEEQDKADAERAKATRVMSGAKAASKAQSGAKAEREAFILALFDQAAETVTTKPKHPSDYRNSMCRMAERLYDRDAPEGFARYKRRKLKEGRKTYNRVFGTVFNRWCESKGLYPSP